MHNAKCMLSNTTLCNKSSNGDPNNCHVYLYATNRTEIPEFYPGSFVRCVPAAFQCWHEINSQNQAAGKLHFKGVNMYDYGGHTFWPRIRKVT